MKIYAISDLHLTGGTDKPMDIFGVSWIGHWDKIRSDWKEKVEDDDVVLIAGDISWGMSLEQAMTDLNEISALRGKKIIIRGNHDYWWSTYKKLCALNLNGIYFLQNNAVVVGDAVFCGTRGWSVPEKEEQSDEDKKIFDREIIRLGMSLSEAKKIADGREIIGMIHYPPFNSRFEKSEFTKLFSEAGIKKVVYGHLHGQHARYKDGPVVIDGVRYYLTSCDYLDNKLMLL